MAIELSDFATECARHALRFGINSHYLVAAAQLRSKISEGKNGDRIGPFMITQQEWDANCSDAELGINDFLPDDINFWDMQCAIYALMTLRAQDRLLGRLARYPSAVELYKEQWPEDQVDLPRELQEALDFTAASIIPAMTTVLGAPPEGTSAITKAEDPASPPAPDRAKPVPAKGEELFVVKAPRIMEKLIDDFELKDFQAAGILGNIGHECAGFRLMQEVKPIGGGRGGFGWCQWTGSRRDDFEAFCKKEGLNPTSDAANYGNLKRELETTHRKSINVLKPTTGLEDAVREFEKEFERAHKDHKHYDRRERWGKLALDNFERQLPSAVAKVLDPDLTYKVLATAKEGSTTYWVVDQFSEGGGQVLLKQTGATPPEILATDTTIFPLPAGLVPAAVADVLARDFESVDDPHPPLPSPTPTSNDEIAQRVFTEARNCDDTLVTRKVANTNNGRLACAWAVNEVVRRALGKPIGGGLSTIEMGKVLSAKHNEVEENGVVAGMVVISPTRGKNVGHVGIVGAIKNPFSDTVIYSNSSNRAVFSHAFSVATWKSFYKNRKGLPVRFYALQR